ncbi:hypothetical protein TeGR_g2332 [Tetraparma gracilis]|uniref:HORMA domain-containing protein n=1 Tax=Tetraparma gracilis TaxID=2962635 RepID=A0ABQ6MGE2_9STRA|nr:hypothetical protein TeGR_g2332 [Tetraparma gracilis]
MSTSDLPSLLTELLELSIHQLLHSRGLYPASLFQAASYLGTKVHTSRHPDINSYIADSVAVAAPSLLSGTATALNLSLLTPSSLLERYTFSLPMAPAHGNPGVPRQHLPDLANACKRLLLQVIMVPRRAFPPDASFSLSLQTRPPPLPECGPLEEALGGGRWRQADTAAERAPDEFRTRAVGSAEVKGIGFGLQLYRVGRPGEA